MYNYALESLVALFDGRIVADGAYLVCKLFWPPRRVQHAVNDCIINLHSIDAVHFLAPCPILDVWNACSINYFPLMRFLNCG